MQPVVIFRTEETKQSAIRRIQAIKPSQEAPLACYIGPYKKIRSLAQNAAYWRLIGVVADATGHDRDVLHYFFKKRAFGIRVERVGDEEIEVVPSSAQVNKGDFSSLIEHVQAFISENNLEESL